MKNSIKQAAAVFLSLAFMAGAAPADAVRYSVQDTVIGTNKSGTFIEEDVTLKAPATQLVPVSTLSATAVSMAASANIADVTEMFEEEEEETVFNVVDLTKGTVIKEGYQIFPSARYCTVFVDNTAVITLGEGKSSWFSDGTYVVSKYEYMDDDHEAIYFIKETTYTKHDAVAPTYETEGSSEYYTGSDGKFYRSDGNKYIEIREGSWVIPKLSRSQLSAVSVSFPNGNTFTQTGSAVGFDLTLTDGEAPLSEGTDYEVFEGDLSASDIGTYMVKVRGLGKYEGELTIPWYIVPADVTVSVNGEAADGFEFGQSFTVSAPEAPEGQRFSHWEANGEAMSYSADYSFIVRESVDLTPVYAAEEEAAAAEPVLTLRSSQTVYNGRNAIGFEFTHTTPDSYTIQEVGLLYATNKLAGADTENAEYAKTVDLTGADIDIVNAVRNNESGMVRSFTADYTNNSGTVFFSYAVGSSTDCYVYAVGYIRCKDDSAQEVTLYTDLAAVTYNTI